MDQLFISSMRTVGVCCGYVFSATEFLALKTIDYVIQTRFAIPIFSIGTSLIVDRILRYSIFNNRVFIEIKIRILEFHRKHPLIRPITFISLYIFKDFAPLFCCGLAVALGIYSGILMQMELNLIRMQRNLADENRNNNGLHYLI